MRWFILEAADFGLTFQKWGEFLIERFDGSLTRVTCVQRGKHIHTVHLGEGTISERSQIWKKYRCTCPRAMFSPYCRHTTELCSASAWCLELSPSHTLHHETAAASFAALIARSKGMPLSEPQPPPLFCALRFQVSTASVWVQISIRLRRTLLLGYTSPPPDHP